MNCNGHCDQGRLCDCAEVEDDISTGLIIWPAVMVVVVSLGVIILTVVL